MKWISWDHVVKLYMMIFLFYVVHLDAAKKYEVGLKMLLSFLGAYLMSDLIGAYLTHKNTKEKEKPKGEQWKN